ncbi:MAG: hypothetical protein JWP15_1752, partial [Alphaproteobacteria bacterium]|nr:hypothetical protein [Alphaproteobacteria bacterium]
TQYDHREWVRQQDMHLAQYQPPQPPRTPRAFGWGGWIVSLLLAGVILLMARDREDLARVDSPGADIASPAHAATRTADADSGAQPSFLKSGGPEREVEMLRRAANVSAAATASQAQARAFMAGEELRVSPPRKIRAKAVRRRSVGKQGRRKKDFLEREGYIY